MLEKIDCYRQPLEQRHLVRMRQIRQRPLREDEGDGICERLGGPAPSCTNAEVCPRWLALPGGQEQPEALAIFSLWMDLLRMRGQMGSGIGVGAWFIEAQTAGMDEWERRMLAQDIAALEAWRAAHADELNAAAKSGDDKGDDGA